jgi:beta-phosphoglucomutase-like phosphatase (HAD superfamily)
MSSFAAAFDMDGCVTDTTSVEQNASRELKHKLAGRRNVPAKNPKFDRKDLGR